MTKSFTFGILASFFFSITFVLNRQMNLEGGSWYYSAALRFLFMFVILLFILLIKGRLSFVMKIMRDNLSKWILWSTVGFGIFYTPIAFASSYGASWLVASTWQITIIAGILLTPLFYDDNHIRKKLPTRQLIISSIILIGVVLVQFDSATKTSFTDSLLVMIPVILAAFAYPLGNRKVMELNKGTLNTLERVFAMTFASLPFWIVITLLGYLDSSLPKESQIIQSLIVAISSGIIATLLFFQATDMERENTKHLAIIESTQAGEIIFTLLLSILLFNDILPSLIGTIGIIIVVIGMVSINFSKEK